jgi:hypothetical protein
MIGVARRLVEKLRVCGAGTQGLARTASGLDDERAVGWGSAVDEIEVHAGIVGGGSCTSG